VVGHEAEDIVRALALNFKFQISDFNAKSSSSSNFKFQTSNFKLLMNDDFNKGMTTSIQTGVQAARVNSSGYMICLSDMPFIAPAEYRFLADAFLTILERDKQAIVQPIFEGQRGNPTIFSSFYKKDILDLTYTEGCKPIVQTHKEHLYLVEMPTDSVVKDIDFRQEYDRLNQL
jgi:molybdenum cofactor cytidylyltransferase